MIILLTGTDKYRIEQVINKYKAQLNPDFLTLNYHRFQSDQIEDAINTARTYPFYGDYQLIIVDDCDFSTLNKNFDFSLFKYLPHLPPKNLLIFTADKIDKRLKLVKHLIKNTTAQQHFELISPWRDDLIYDYIENVSEKAGLRLNKRIIDYLVVAIGNDTARIHSEVNKLKLTLSHRNHSIKLSEVKQLIPHHNHTSLDLADALRKGDSDAILLLTQSLLSHAHHPLAITATLITQFRTWLWVASAAQLTENHAEIASLCHLNQPRLYYLLPQVQPLSLPTLTFILSQLLEIDLALKQGSHSHTLLTHLLLLSQFIKCKRELINSLYLK